MFNFPRENIRNKELCSADSLNGGCAAPGCGAAAPAAALAGRWWMVAGGGSAEDGYMPKRAAWACAEMERRAAAEAQARRRVHYARAQAALRGLAEGRERAKAKARVRRAEERRRFRDPIARLIAAGELSDGQIRAAEEIEKVAALAGVGFYAVSEAGATAARGAFAPNPHMARLQALYVRFRPWAEYLQSGRSRLGGDGPRLVTITVEVVTQRTPFYLYDVRGRRKGWARAGVIDSLGEYAGLARW